MTHLRLGFLRIWLLSLMMAIVVGCGGHDDAEIDVGDAASDVRRDTTSDRGDAGDALNSDVRTDGAIDVTADGRVDVTADTRIDVPVVDNRIDTPTIDVRVDPPTTIDVRVDPAVDTRIDTPVVDVRIDTPVIDVRVDTPVVDVRIDTPVVDAGGCTIDAQCTDGTNTHCNVNTRKCVAPVALSVTPANSSIALGTTQQFAATMTYSDASTSNVTAQATWISSNTGIATMSTTTVGLADGIGIGTSSISAIFSNSSGNFSGSTNLTVTMAILESIQVTPANTSSPLGTTRQFTATGVYTDKTTQNITSTVTWASSMPAFATINAAGLANTVAEGATSISATLGAISNAVTFTVTTKALVSIEVTPPTASINVISTQAFAATGVYTDGSKVPLTTGVTWTSSDTNVAPIANTSTGVTATGIAAGQSTISATFGTVTGSAVLTVTGATLTSVDITPANPTIPVGFNQQFKATGHFNGAMDQDLTTDVLWASGTTATATISNATNSNGLANGVAVGTSDIQATFAGFTAHTTLTVVVGTLNSIDVTPSSPSVAQGLMQQFTAIGHFNNNAIILDITQQASWSSTATAIATVVSGGLATGVAQGSATINATYMNVAGSTLFTVTAPNLVSIEIKPSGSAATLAVNASLQFTATGHYTGGPDQDITNTVTWLSADVQFFDVVHNGGAMPGLVTATNTPGMANLEAHLSNIDAVMLVTVTP